MQQGLVVLPLEVLCDSDSLTGRLLGVWILPVYALLVGIVHIELVDLPFLVRECIAVVLSQHDDTLKSSLDDFVKLTLFLRAIVLIGLHSDNNSTSILKLSPLGNDGRGE